MSFLCVSYRRSNPLLFFFLDHSGHTDFRGVLWPSGIGKGALVTRCHLIASFDFNSMPVMYAL